MASKTDELVELLWVAAQSRERVSRSTAKTTHRRTPAKRRSILRIDRLLAGGGNESFLALLFR